MTPDERRRLLAGPDDGEQPGPLGTEAVVARCDDAAAVAQRTKDVLLALPDLPDGASDDPDRWGASLPSWFTAHFDPEWTEEELAAVVAAADRETEDERKANVHGGPWTLASWLYQLEPRNRFWYWWDAHVEPDGRTLRVDVGVTDWPIAIEALLFVLHAAGATQIEVLD